MVHRMAKESGRVLAQDGMSSANLLGAVMRGEGLSSGNLKTSLVKTGSSPSAASKDVVPAKSGPVDSKS